MSALFELTPERGAAYIGKRILVGVTRYDRRGHVVEMREFHGIVESVTHFITLRTASGAAISVPPMVHLAEPGIYHLRNSGDVVESPDLLSEWEVHSPNRVEAARKRRFRSIALRAERRRA